MLSLPAPVRDAALLLARIAIGAVFFAHGWQKLFTNGIDGTTRFSTSVGVPLPGVSAWAATVLELVGGAALVLGAAVPVVGVLLALDMLGPSSSCTPARASSSPRAAGNSCSRSARPRCCSPRSAPAA